MGRETSVLRREWISKWLLGGLGLLLMLGCETPPGIQVGPSPAASPSQGPSASPTPPTGPSPSPLPAASLGPFAVLSGTSLQAARSQHTSHVIGAYLYVVGGNGGASSALSSVERASISTDGRLGAFSTLTGTQLARPRYGHASVVIGSYLYVLGGWDDMQVASNTLERAVINTNGTIGPFSIVEGVTLETSRYGALAQVIGDTLYVFGGDGNTQTTAEKATIQEDGTLSDFTSTPSNGTGVPRLFSMGHATPQFFYLIGGELEASAERAPLKADRTLGAFSPVASASLSEPRDFAAGLAIGNRYFVLGGLGTHLEASLLYASIGTDGNLGEFVPFQQALTRPSMGHTCHLIGQNLYVIGGQDDLMNAYSRLEKAPLQ